MSLGRFLNILVFGQPHVRAQKVLNPAFKNQVRNVKRVWRNQNYKDFGIERLIRLFLAVALFSHVSLYVRDISGRYGLLWRKVGVEIYVLIKLLLPGILLYTGAYAHWLGAVLATYMIYETVTYLAALVFLAPEFAQPISYRRSIATLLMNYVEVMLDFAVIYAYFNSSHIGFLNKTFASSMEAVYFSAVTAATVGYGDFYAHSTLAQVIIVLEILTFVVFVGLFLTHFVSKIQETTYFNTKPNYPKAPKRDGGTA